MPAIDVEKYLTKPFPPPPIDDHPYLKPLCSIVELDSDWTAKGIDFDSFWIDQIFAGVAYFFAWNGEADATVLIVFEEDAILHIEVRTNGGKQVRGDQLVPIAQVLLALIEGAGMSMPASTLNIMH